jgi:hypothetical protein
VVVDQVVTFDFCELLLDQVCYLLGDVGMSGDLEWMGMELFFSRATRSHPTGRSKPGADGECGNYRVRKRERVISEYKTGTADIDC